MQLLCSARIGWYTLRCPSSVALLNNSSCSDSPASYSHPFSSDLLGSALALSVSLAACGALALEFHACGIALRLGVRLCGQRTR